MMETYAIGCALKRKIQRKEIDVLKKLLRESEENIKNNNYKRFMEKDRDFHYLLVKISNNRKLCEFYRQLNIHMQIARSYYVRNYKQLQETQKEHEKISYSSYHDCKKVGHEKRGEKRRSICWKFEIRFR